MCDRRYNPEREHGGRGQEGPCLREERSIKHSDLPSRSDGKIVKPPVNPSDQMHVGEGRSSDD